MTRLVLRCVAAAIGTLLLASLPASAAASTGGPSSFLHVGASGGPAGLPQIVDSSGREVLLKGVNADGLVDYFRTDLAPPYPSAPASYSHRACPPDAQSVEGVDLCEHDFSQLAPLGYNVIRLNISWSLVEPTPGKIDAG